MQSSRGKCSVDLIAVSFSNLVCTSSARNPNYAAHCFGWFIPVWFSTLRFSQVLRGQFVGPNSHCFSLSLERRAKRDSPSNLLRIFDFDEEWTQLQVRLEGPTIWSHGFTFVASVFSRLCHQCSVYTGCLFDRINERWAMNASKCWPDLANKSNDELATVLAALNRSSICTIELSRT